MSELLRVEKLSKSYFIEKKEIRVLKEVSFQVNRGEMISIVGASGAGKSTLLHILGALDHPTAGQIFFDQHSIFKKNEKELSKFRNQKIGFVFQFHHLLPEFSALENVCLPALIQGIARHQAIEWAQAKLSEVGLEHRVNHKPGELSGGEQQRVAIARALILNPPLLLADELTGNLDTQTGEQVQNLLIKLNQIHQMTMIVVTHNELLAQKLPRCLRMVDGMLQPS